LGSLPISPGYFGNDWSIEQGEFAWSQQQEQKP
jgi:hypothetical protein